MSIVFFFSSSPSLVAQVRKVARSSALRVYWYWAKLWRPPICTSCTDCRKRLAPETLRNLLRSRAMISSSETWPARWVFGRRVTNTWPPAERPPVKPATRSTSGSDWMMLTNRVSRFWVSWKEVLWSVCMKPCSWALLCCGRNPLGTTP